MKNESTLLILFPVNSSLTQEMIPFSPFSCQPLNLPRAAASRAQGGARCGLPGSRGEWHGLLGFKKSFSGVSLQ